MQGCSGHGLPSASKYAQPPFLLRMNQTSAPQTGHSALGSEVTRCHWMPLELLPPRPSRLLVR